MSDQNFQSKPNTRQVPIYGTRLPFELSHGRSENKRQIFEQVREPVFAKPTNQSTHQIPQIWQQNAKSCLSLHTTQQTSFGSKNTAYGRPGIERAIVDFSRTPLLTRKNYEFKGPNV